jgi:predicted phage terminase large subunit-like protein
MEKEDFQRVRGFSLEKALRVWSDMEKSGRQHNNLDYVVRNMCLNDLAYLLIRACRRTDMAKPWIYDRIREVEADPYGHLDLWAREHYKDLADTTPILTTEGWKNHGDLKRGDIVYSPDGNPVEVLAVTEQYNDSECYKITFHDKTSIVAGAGHLWKLRVKHRLRVGNWKDENRITTFTEEIVQTNQLSTDKRCDVSVAKALVMSVKQLPIDPYVFGAWLGDGNSDSARITCNYSDIGIINRIKEKGVYVEEGKSSNKNSGIFSLNKGIKGKRNTGMTSILRKIGALKNKHIPEEYLNSSIYQRQELLRGLMDTDGSCNPRGTAYFVNISKTLTENVYELAIGLGLRPRFKEREMRVNNEPYPYYQVTFQAYKDRNPFHLKRKADRAIDKYLHRETRLVSKIERIDSVPTKCIQVEGGMYLAGKELIPTHNSTIQTFGQNIQSILQDPDITIGIFSHTRPIAKAFLRQIMRELQENQVLHNAFPDVLWGKNIKESPKWSEDDGIIVKRKSNPKEATVEAWGLVDGQPTSKHFMILNYDDIVVAASVTTPDMINKTLNALEQSYNLGVTPEGKRKFIGTCWHFSDAYATIKERETAILRWHPGREGGTNEGKSVFWPEEVHVEKRKSMGIYNYSAQILLNPKEDSLQGFQREWIQNYDNITLEQEKRMNKYILIDGASEKKKTSDYTFGWVIGLAADQNYYVLDMVRDRLKLSERADLVFRWHKRYKPKQVRYEKYGCMADIEHFESRMQDDNYRFVILEVGGQTPKNDRIKRTMPLFEQNRIYFPRSLHYTNWDKKTVDLVKDFIEQEYLAFPVGKYDDGLDSLARICEPDMDLVFPKEEIREEKPVSSSLPTNIAWMGN